MPPRKLTCTIDRATVDALSREDIVEMLRRQLAINESLLDEMDRLAADAEQHRIVDFLWREENKRLQSTIERRDKEIRKLRERELIITVGTAKADISEHLDTTAYLRFKKARRLAPRPKYLRVIDGDVPLTRPKPYARDPNEPSFDPDPVVTAAVRMQMQKVG